MADSFYKQMYKQNTGIINKKFLQSNQSFDEKILIEAIGSEATN